MTEDEEPTSCLACSVRCRTRLLLATLAVVLCLGGHMALRPPAPTPFATCHGDSPILIGTHHKTGTVLMRHILRTICPLLSWRCSIDNEPMTCNSADQARAAGFQVCFLQHGIQFKKVQSTERPFRFVHVMRDPMEVVISGYKYHLKTTERWALRPDKRYNGTSYRQYLNTLSMTDGLRAELKHSMKDALKTMPRLLNRTQDRPCTLTLRLEDFERDWRGTTARLWDVLGVQDPGVALRLDEAIAKHDVYHSDRPGYYNPHVTSGATGSRGAVRALIRGVPDLYGRIQDVRRRLGYPIEGREMESAY